MKKKYQTKKRLHKKQQLTEILFILFLIILPVAVIGNASVRTLQAYDEDIATAVIQPKNHIGEANKMVVDKELTVKEYIKSEIEKSGLDWKLAECIIQNESGFDEYAINKNTNGTYDTGIWQINQIHKLDRKITFDYKESTKWAINKRLHDGNWSAWYGVLKCK